MWSHFKVYCIGKSKLYYLLLVSVILILVVSYRPSAHTKHLHTVSAWWYEKLFCESSSLCIHSDSIKHICYPYAVLLQVRFDASVQSISYIKVLYTYFIKLYHIHNYREFGKLKSICQIFSMVEHVIMHFVAWTYDTCNKPSKCLCTQLSMQHWMIEYLFTQ